MSFSAADETNDYCKLGEKTAHSYARYTKGIEGLIIRLINTYPSPTSLSCNMSWPLRGWIL